MRVWAAVLVLLIGQPIAGSGGVGEPAGSAVEQFQELQGQLREAHTAKDWAADLAAAKAMREFLHDAPDSLLEVARADVGAGDVEAAAAELEVYVRMGQSTDVVERLAEFAPLLKSARYGELREGMKANGAAVLLGRAAFTVPDPELLAEDVDYDRRGKRFLVTSVRQHKIVAVMADGGSRDFAVAPDGWPMLAIRVDPVRKVVWATEAAMQGYVFSAKADWGRSAVVCYELGTGKLLRRIEGPRGTDLGDMVLMGNGDVVVSDGDGGGVYRASSGSAVLERVDAGDFISPQTPAVSPDGLRLYVPDYVRGIGVLDLATKKVRWISGAGRYALSGIDGLYFDRGKLVAVQNGTSPARVVVFTLDAAKTGIVGETVVERRPAMGVPTHGVVVGKTFYYLANAGWDFLDDSGAVKAGMKATPARMMRFDLGE